MKALMRYPGAKWNISDWIIAHFPKDYEKMTYLEPYFGSGAVFMNKNRSKIETINDMDKRVVNLFKVTRDNPKELERLISLTPWSRDEYLLSYEVSEEPEEDARRFLVRMWQAFGGKTSDITGWANNIKPIDTGKSGWVKIKDIIKVTAERFIATNGKMIQIENKPALELIERYNFDYVFMYLDPPYLMSTRKKRIYKHEMTEEDYVELLKAIQDSKAKVMISGYDSELYNTYLKSWNKKHTETTTEMHRTAIETIWFNYEVNEQITIEEMLKGRE